MRENAETEKGAKRPFLMPVRQDLHTFYGFDTQRIQTGLQRALR